MPYEYAALVRRVVDGDTVRLDVDLGFSTWSRDLSVRLLGANARESHEPGGKAATENLSAILPAGSAVMIRTVKPDKFGGRWLAAITTADGRDLAALLIAGSWAAPWNGSGPRPLPPWPRPTVL